MMDTSKKQKLVIGELDAARRQLHTAIREWFCGGDPVVIHTLACAAYEIIHSLGLRRNPTRPDLLFDTDLIKDEYRKEYVNRLRKPANLFRHADRDGDSVIEFSPAQSDAFILYSILGIRLCGECSNTNELVWLMWLWLQKRKHLTVKGRKFFADNLSVEDINCARTMSREEFFRWLSKAFESSPGGPLPRRAYQIDIPWR
jgi:hypothetical protein